MFRFVLILIQCATFQSCPLQIQVKLKPENCDIAYPPLIQSGGKYDLKVRFVV